MKHKYAVITQFIDEDGCESDQTDLFINKETAEKHITLLSEVGYLETEDGNATYTLYELKELKTIGEQHDDIFS